MHLLRFDDEPAARAALGEILEDCTPTALVTVDAVYDGEEIATPREILPGFWLLSATAPAGSVAEIGHDGVISTSDDAILGARLEPILAGMTVAPLAMAPAAEPESEPVPDGPTLSDWRVALIQMGRFTEVRDAIVAARDTGSVEGLIAWERFEYANHVYRAELLRLAPVMGFDEAKIDESLRTAALIAAGLSG